MKVKTFQGQTMAEALKRVKSHFGPEAVILSTRTHERGALLGLGEKRCVEITAARGMSDLPNGLPCGRLRERTGWNASAEGAATSVSPVSQTNRSTPTEALSAEIGSLRTLVGRLLHETRRSTTAHIPDGLFDSYQKLVQCAVAERMAQQLMEQVQRDLPPERLLDAAAVRKELAKGLASMLPAAGPIKLAATTGPTVIALVGPTGVGKTTTIAKLAANFCLRQRKRVGLITIDTYRIAAVEQLKTYARIIDVPLETVTAPAELGDTVKRMADRDLVLIDTAGHGQRDAVRISELARFFEVVQPHEVHLVLSGTSEEAVLSEAIERFSAVGVDRVIFTKLDEAVGFGVILTCLEKTKAKLSYLTTGQDVPDDIEVGRGPMLADLILGGGA